MTLREMEFNNLKQTEISSFLIMKFELTGTIEDIKAYATTFNTYQYKYLQRSLLQENKYKGDTIVQFQYFNIQTMAFWEEANDLMYLFTDNESLEKTIYIMNLALKLLQKGEARSLNLNSVINKWQKYEISPTKIEKFKDIMIKKLKQRKWETKGCKVLCIHKKFHKLEYHSLEDLTDLYIILPIIYVPRIKFLEPFERSKLGEFESLQFDRTKGILYFNPGKWVIAKFGYTDMFTTSEFFKYTESRTISGLNFKKVLDNEIIFQTLKRDIHLNTFEYFMELIDQNALSFPKEEIKISVQIDNFKQIDQILQKMSQDAFKDEFPPLNNPLKENITQQNLIENDFNSFLNNSNDSFDMDLNIGFDLAPNLDIASMINQQIMNPINTIEETNKNNLAEQQNSESNASGFTSLSEMQTLFGGKFSNILDPSIIGENFTIDNENSWYTDDENNFQDNNVNELIELGFLDDLPKSDKPWEIEKVELDKIALTIDEFMNQKADEFIKIKNYSSKEEHTEVIYLPYWLRSLNTTKSMQEDLIEFLADNIALTQNKKISKFFLLLFTLLSTRYPSIFQKIKCSFTKIIWLQLLKILKTYEIDEKPEYEPILRLSLRLKNGQIKMYKSHLQKFRKQVKPGLEVIEDVQDNAQLTNRFELECNYDQCKMITYTLLSWCFEVDQEIALSHNLRMKFALLKSLTNETDEDYSLEDDKNTTVLFM